VNIVTIVGLGNVGSHLAIAFRQNLFTVYVWGRNHFEASEFAKNNDCICIDSLSNIPYNSDLIILSVADTAIGELTELIPDTSSVVVHTAGSVNIDAFGKTCRNYGVLYPLQSFRKERKLEYHSIPVFIEGSSQEVLDFIADFCNKVFPIQTKMNSEARMQLHLAAVFASNFVNAIYNMSYDIAQKHNIDFTYLLPLIIETATRLNYGSPQQFQTGPALRSDNSVVNKHVEMLKEDKMVQIIYKELTNYIKTKHNKHE